MIRTRRSTTRLTLSACACAAAVGLLGLGPAGARAADRKCTLGRMAEFPITMDGLRPLMTAQINGTDVRFLVDSGAFYSTLSPASAAELKLATHFAPFGLYMQGVGGGRTDVSVATVKTFTLAGVAIKNVDFLVGGSEIGSDSVGVLGQNILHIADVEYDLAQGVIRLMKAADCGKANLAYWAHDMPYSVMSIDAPNGLDRHTGGIAYVNGAEIRVMFDSGAGSSVLSLRAAARVGIKPDSPGVVYAGVSYGLGKITYPTYIAPFSSFKIGDEEIKNTRLRIGDIDLPNADMLLGPDFFLSHHIYVANSQRKLYFTYNGGPVFNLKVKRVVADAAASGNPEAAAAPGTGGETPSQPPAEPDTTASPEVRASQAAELNRQGNAAAARGDLEHALTDLTRACELAPDRPDYFYQRGLAYQENKQPVLALKDFDRSLNLKSDAAPVLISRARLLLQRGEVGRAAADLDAASTAAPQESDLRYRMAAIYEMADLQERAIRQYDLWIEFHSVDARYPAALNGRCWARALLGVDLALALKDCSAARARSPKSSPAFAMVSDSRGLVLLRLGDYGKSIADYDASLKIDPKNPWAWYGRGLDELRGHKDADGQADMAHARALWPQVGDEFKRRGISP